MTSRASILTGQHVAPRIDRFGKQLTPEAFARTYTGVLRAAGYWVGHVGKYDVGARGRMTMTICARITDVTGSPAPLGNACT